MKRKNFLLFVLVSALFISNCIASAADQDQEKIYGSQLMTPQERTEYRDRMHAAKTVEEWEQIRKEHHEHMKTRAAERGLTLPDEPPTRGRGMGPGGGGGMGSRGRGMGRGGMRGR